MKIFFALITTLLALTRVSSLVAPGSSCSRREAVSRWTGASLGFMGLIVQPHAAPAEDDVAAPVVDAPVAAAPVVPAPDFVASDVAAPPALTDEEMAARVARKMELLKNAKAAAAGGKPMAGADVRSDVNPEAGVNLRSKSSFENAKAALEKQKEMKSRDKMQKRDDLCEMLGRGC